METDKPTTRKERTGSKKQISHPVAFESPCVVLFASDVNSYYDGPFGCLPDLVVLSIMHLVPLL